MDGGPAPTLTPGTATLDAPTATLTAITPAPEIQLTSAPTLAHTIERTLAWDPERERAVTWDPRHERTVAWDPVTERVVTWSPLHERAVAWDPVRERTLTLDTQTGTDDADAE